MQACWTAHAVVVTVYEACTQTLTVITGAQPYSAKRNTVPNAYEGSCVVLPSQATGISDAKRDVLDGCRTARKS